MGALYNTDEEAEIARNWEKDSGLVTTGQVTKAHRSTLCAACHARVHHR